MKRIQKRLMALVLAAIMVMGMLPMNVFADTPGSIGGDES